MTAARWLSAPIRALVWTFDVCDAGGAPSLSKGLALLFGIVAARDVWLHGFTALNVAGIALVLSAAFGRSVFMNWLSRYQLTNTTSTNVATAASLSLTGDAAAVVRAVRERRDAASGIDPA